MSVCLESVAETRGEFSSNMTTSLLSRNVSSVHDRIWLSCCVVIVPTTSSSSVVVTVSVVVSTTTGTALSIPVVGIAGLLLLLAAADSPCDALEEGLAACCEDFAAANVLCEGTKDDLAGLGCCDIVFSGTVGDSADFVTATDSKSFAFVLPASNNVPLVLYEGDSFIAGLVVFCALEVGRSVSLSLLLCVLLLTFFGTTGFLVVIEGGEVD